MTIRTFVTSASITGAVAALAAIGPVRAGDGRNGDEGADCHGVSPLDVAAPAP